MLNELDQLSKNIGRLIAISGQHQHRLRDLESQLTHTRDERDGLHAEIEALRAERDALRGELRLVTAERDLAEERLRAYKRELFGASSEARNADQIKH